VKKVAVLLRSNLTEWVQLLRVALPRHTIVGDAAEAADAAYAVVGKPAAGVLAALAKLQVVFSVNAGVEALLESGEVPAGIPIVRMVDDGLAEGMLEWVRATTLAWHRNLFSYREQQSKRQWTPLREILARDRRLTVLGAGHLGGRVAATLAQIGFNTRVWSRTPKQIAGVASLAGDGALRDAVRGSEILINLLPLTAATENLLDAPLLAELAPNAVLINAGRGRHLVDQAVLDMLDSGRLRAAILDVFREEPLAPDHPFWRHPGIYITPHVAAPTHASSAVAAIAENLLGYEAGASLQHVVELARGY
jgi:glyoxylate/hydroxypyruvate reductase A